MKLGLDDKVENELNRMAQVRWKEIIEETEAQLLGLDENTYKIMRVYFQMAYEAATADTLIQMKEIYHNDVYMFQAMFEDDEDELN